MNVQNGSGMFLAFLASLSFKRLCNSSPLNSLRAHDADMVIMNRMISLESFLPPKNKDYNLLVTYDGNGLNIGSFFIKINTWSVYLLSAVLASPQLGTATGSLYPDQDVMGQLIKHNPFFKEKTIEVSLIVELILLVLLYLPVFSPDSSSLGECLSGDMG